MWIFISRLTGENILAGAKLSILLLFFLGQDLHFGASFYRPLVLLHLFLLAFEVLHFTAVHLPQATWTQKAAHAAWFALMSIFLLNNFSEWWDPPEALRAPAWVGRVVYSNSFSRFSAALFCSTSDLTLREPAADAESKKER